MELLSPGIFFIACSITTVILHASYYSIIQFSFKYTSIS
jgi:hypothetical protein